MYETPSLTYVGSAENTIRGICSVGYDIDTLFMNDNLEFRSDMEAVPPAE